MVAYDALKEAIIRGDECLNENWFLSLEDARDKVGTWQEEYNRWRPHSALCNLSPEEFIRVKELVG